MIDFMRRWVAILNDREMVVQHGRALMAPGFVRYDRRRLIAAPPADADEFVAALLALEDVAGGWPSSKLEEIVAVRGDRLLVCRWTIGVGDDF